MINDLINFAKYRSPKNGVEEISSKDDLNDFQKELFRNWDSNFLIGKGRQQTVSTSLAWLSYYRAAHLSQDVAIKTVKMDMVTSLFQSIKLFCPKSDIQRDNKTELKFTNGGKIQAISKFDDYIGKKFHSVFIDETGPLWDINPVQREVEEARHTMPFQIIAAVTVREKSNYNDEKFIQNLNQLLWTLKEYQGSFKYIEAWNKGTLLSDRDIRAYRSMIK